MKKLFFLLLVPLLLGAEIATPPKDDKLSTETQQYLKDIYEELKTQGIKLPSGAIFFMITGSCPTGSTDVTATYADKFVRINSTQGTTGGSDTATLIEGNLPVHTHPLGTLAVDNESAHTHTQGNNQVATGGAGSNLTLQANSNSVTSVSTGAGSAHTHSLSGALGNTGSGNAVTITNPYVTCRLCQVD